MVASRFDVCLVRLDLTQGHEIKKTRPCVVISPDELNRHISTVIVAPMTSKVRDYATRVPITFQGVVGEIVLDQIRTVDKDRLIKSLGTITGTVAARKVLEILADMFAP